MKRSEHNDIGWLLPAPPPPKKDKTWSSKAEIAWLNEIQRQMGIEIQTAETGQFTITGPNKRKIKADGYYALRKYWFEFHGCKFHGCGCKPEYINQKLYTDTITRQDFIVSQGYTLFVIWEHEWELYKKGKTTTLYTMYN